jgi:hypothetical protein
VTRFPLTAPSGTTTLPFNVVFGRGAGVVDVIQPFKTNMNNNKIKIIEKFLSLYNLFSPFK